MEKRKLNGTDLDVSRVCLGTMTFGSQVDESEAATMIDYCLDQGINFIDTANSYNGGRSEEIIGRCLKTRRDRVILATKVFNKMGDNPDQSGLSRAAIIRGIEDSLRRLQTDHLDVYYLHAPDYTVPLEESLDAMDQLVRDGKIRHIGVSNYASWQLTRLLWIADRSGLATIKIAQPMYNLIARGIEQEFLPSCKEFGVSTVVYNPLAGGILTGKHSHEKPIHGTRFDLNKQYVDRYWHRSNFEAVQELQTIADKAGRSIISLAFNWLLHHSQTDSIILGASGMNHLETNLKDVQAGPLPESAVEGCDRAWSKLRGDTPRYNR